MGLFNNSSASAAGVGGAAPVSYRDRALEGEESRWSVSDDERAKGRKDVDDKAWLRPRTWGRRRPPSSHSSHSSRAPITPASISAPSPCILPSSDLLSPPATHRPRTASSEHSGDASDSSSIPPPRPARAPGRKREKEKTVEDEWDAIAAGEIETKRTTATELPPTPPATVRLPDAPTFSSPPASTTTRPRTTSSASAKFHKPASVAPAAEGRTRSGTITGPPPPPTASVSASASIGTPPSPLASLYLVSGLPKDPASWVFADPDAVAGVHHSEGAVGRWWRAEVLGTTVSPGVAIPGGDPGAGGKSKRSRQGGMSKSELGKVLAKALKLSFTQEVEIISSTLQPASTLHTFSFNLPTPPPASVYARGSVASSMRSTGAEYSHVFSDPGDGAGVGGPYSFLNEVPAGLGVGMGGRGRGSMDAPVGGVRGGGEGRKGSQGWHGVTLTVWSHADPTRALAIRRALAAARKSSSVSHHSRASSHAATSERVLRKKFGPGDASGRGGADEAIRVSAAATSGTETDGDAETEGGWTDQGLGEWEMGVLGGGGMKAGLAIEGEMGGVGAGGSMLPEGALLWMPYCLTLVSKHPLYDLLGDYLCHSWAVFSRDISSHSAQMLRLLETPAPRQGELIRLSTSKDPLLSKDRENEEKRKSTSGVQDSLVLIGTMPGALDFGKQLVEVNHAMWPLFKSLSLDNILTIAEIALAPTGRVLFLSRHPQILGVACLTLRYIVEARGWAGVCHPIMHARDYRILLEDPGQSILGARTELRYSMKPPPEVCVVDLDINHVLCPAPPVGYVSTDALREKLRKKLVSAIGTFRPDESVPSEFKEAFPSGRFMPLSRVEARGRSAATIERIHPPFWWDDKAILGAFDNVLRSRTKKPSLIKRLTHPGERKPPSLTQGEKLAQAAIRRRATQFVDSRDELETKIGRLNRRLAFLVAESDRWKHRFEQFENYAERLSAEATELRNKIEKERRESRRLSGMILQQTKARDSLVEQLRRTEALRENALNELGSMQSKLEDLEKEREDMISHIQGHLSEALIQLDTVSASGNLSSRADSPMSMHSSRSRDSSYSSILPNSDPTSSSAGRDRSESITSIPEDAAGEQESLAAEDSPRSSMVSASAYARPISFEGSVDFERFRINPDVQSTMTAIQAKLESALAELEMRRRQSTESSRVGIALDGEPDAANLEDVRMSVEQDRLAEAQAQAAPPGQDKSKHRGRSPSTTSLSGVSTSGTATPRAPIAYHKSAAPVPAEPLPPTPDEQKYARNNKTRSVHAPARYSGIGHHSRHSSSTTSPAQHQHQQPRTSTEADAPLRDPRSSPIPIRSRRTSAGTSEDDSAQYVSAAGSPTSQRSMTFGPGPGNGSGVEESDSSSNFPRNPKRETFGIPPVLVGYGDEDAPDANTDDDTVRIETLRQLEGAYDQAHKRAGSAGKVSSRSGGGSRSRGTRE